MDTEGKEALCRNQSPAFIHSQIILIKKGPAAALSVTIRRSVWDLLWVFLSCIQWKASHRCVYITRDRWRLIVCPGAETHWHLFWDLGCDRSSDFFLSTVQNTHMGREYNILSAWKKKKQAHSHLPLGNRSHLLPFCSPGAPLEGEKVSWDLFKFISPFHMKYLFLSHVSVRA